MKYKRSIALIGACAIVSASVVAPFSYADFDFIDIANSYFDYLTDLTNGTLGQAYSDLLSDYKTVGQVSVSGGTEYIFIIDDIQYYSSGGGALSKPYIVVTFGFGSVYRKNGGSWIPYTGKFKLSLDNYYSFSTRWQSSPSLIYVDIPFNWYDSDGGEHSLTSDFSTSIMTPVHRDSGTLSNNLSIIINRYDPPETLPPYTTPAPAFPNLPDNWVNGGGDVDIKIDLPDIDFNLPDLPDYTLPSAPTIPEQFQTGISTVFGKIWDIVVQSGLVWLVVFSLTCSLIIYILSR